MQYKSFNDQYLQTAQNVYAEAEYMMPFTHFIKLSLTVDFILVNKCQHDPVTDNGTLEGWNEK